MAQDGPRDWRRFVLRSRPAAAASGGPQHGDAGIGSQPSITDVPSLLARSQDAILATGVQALQGYANSKRPERHNTQAGFDSSPSAHVLNAHSDAHCQLSSLLCVSC